MGAEHFVHGKVDSGHHEGKMSELRRLAASETELLCDVEFEPARQLENGMIWHCAWCIPYDEVAQQFPNANITSGICKTHRAIAESKHVRLAKYK